MDTTCKNCIYANECIMYDTAMRRCTDYKERRTEDDTRN